MVRYSLIIPAYNEEATIECAVRTSWRVLSSLSEESELIVIDDGSTDETIARVERIMREFPKDRLRLLRLSPNQGKGGAVRAGMLIAQGERIGFLDADLASPPETMQTGFALLDDAHVAIGSRRLPEAAIALPQAWYRSWAGQLFNLVLRAWFGIPYRDTQCGCKFFRREAARRLFEGLRTPGWAFDVEILVRARALGYRVGEFPVIWKNGPKTRVRFAHAFRILRDLWRIKRIDS